MNQHTALIAKINEKAGLETTHKSPAKLNPHGMIRVSYTFDDSSFEFLYSLTIEEHRQGLFKKIYWAAKTNVILTVTPVMVA